jgi:hypothetical protein
MNTGLSVTLGVNTIGRIAECKGGWAAFDDKGARLPGAPLGRGEAVAAVVNAARKKGGEA